MNVLNKPSEETFLRVAEALEKQVKINEVVDLIGLPGLRTLVAGDKNAGFLGFVKSSELITGSALALAIGLSSGTVINDTTPWIKYIWKGKICFTPLKPLRHSTVWEAIYNAGAVYGTDDNGILPPKGRAGANISINAADNSINTTNQNFLGDLSAGMDYADTAGAVGDILVLNGWANATNNGEVTISSITNNKIIVTGKVLVTEAGNRTNRFYKKTNGKIQNAKVTIGGVEGRVRLMRGASQDPLKSYNDADRDSIGLDNEWNACILPLHEHAKLQNWIYPAYAGTTEDFGIYLTDKDLIIHYLFGGGSYRWLQETQDTTSWRRVTRGYAGASGLTASHSWNVTSYHSFCPVLEFPQASAL